MAKRAERVEAYFSVTSAHIRAALFARWFASRFSARGILSIANSSPRASFRQTQCSEYSRGLRHAYSPLICRTTTSESEYTHSDRAFRSCAHCSASSSATYSATLLSCQPIHFAMRVWRPAASFTITPMPAGPGLPCELPSTYATNRGTSLLMRGLCWLLSCLLSALLFEPCVNESQPSRAFCVRPVKKFPQNANVFSTAAPRHHANALSSKRFDQFMRCHFCTGCTNFGR